MLYPKFPQRCLAIVVLCFTLILGTVGIFFLMYLFSEQDSSLLPAATFIHNEKASTTVARNKFAQQRKSLAQESWRKTVDENQNQGRETQNHTGSVINDNQWRQYLDRNYQPDENLKKKTRDEDDVVANKWPLYQDPQINTQMTVKYTSQKIHNGNNRNTDNLDTIYIDDNERVLARVLAKPTHNNDRMKTILTNQHQHKKRNEFKVLEKELPLSYHWWRRRITEQDNIRNLDTLYDAVQNFTGVLDDEDSDDVSNTEKGSYFSSSGSGDFNYDRVSGYNATHGGFPFRSDYNFGRLNKQQLPKFPHVIAKSNSNSKVKQNNKKKSRRIPKSQWKIKSPTETNTIEKSQLQQSNASPTYYLNLDVIGVDDRIIMELGVRKQNAVRLSNSSTTELLKIDKGQTKINASVQKKSTNDQIASGNSKLGVSDQNPNHSFNVKSNNKASPLSTGNSWLETSTHRILGNVKKSEERSRQLLLCEEAGGGELCRMLFKGYLNEKLEP